MPVHALRKGDAAMNVVEFLRNGPNPFEVSRLSNSKCWNWVIGAVHRLGFRNIRGAIRANAWPDVLSEAMEAYEALET